MKSLIKDLLVAARAPQLWQRLRHRRTLTILAYHAIVDQPRPIYNWCFHTAARFREEMAYLKRHFDVVSLHEAVQLLERDALERPTAVVTFDDGYQNNYDIAFPILKEAAIPATIFLTTGLINTDQALWDARLHEAIEQTMADKLVWRNERYDLRSHDLKAEASRSLQEALKALPYGDVESEIATILNALAVQATEVYAQDSPYRMLNRQSIEEMLASKLIAFGAHAQHHAILSQLDSATKKSFMEASLDDVANITGAPCTSFAFPNGRMQDYDAACLDVLRGHGVEAAVTMIGGPNSAKTPRLELRRYGVAAQSSPANFRIQAHHFRSV